MIIGDVCGHGPDACGLALAALGRPPGARRGRAALRRSRAAGSRLILLDLNLPRRDGREVLAVVKAGPALRSTPVVVLTTSEAVVKLPQ